jgi:endonuclease YncB( thermonuclease family)
VAGLSGLSAGPHADIAGVASVIDADTIEIHGQRIRLYGIDAPESCQTCIDASGRTWRCGQRAALGLQD